MEAIRHMATCTNNNRRLARFYRLIFGMEEVWNEEQNSPYAFYVTDGYFNLNCLQIHQTMAETKRNVGTNHFGLPIGSLAEKKKKTGGAESAPSAGAKTERRALHRSQDQRSRRKRSGFGGKGLGNRRREKNSRGEARRHRNARSRAFGGFLQVHFRYERSGKEKNRDGN